MATDIILDPRIRDCVLLPLTLIVVFMGLGQHYVTLLTGKGPSCSDRGEEPVLYKVRFVDGDEEDMEVSLLSLVEPYRAYAVRCVWSQPCNFWRA
jgi:hypothetical protein